MHSDVVDKPPFDERLPFMRVVEEFTHGNGRGAVLPNLLEVGQVFWRQRILKKEHVKLLRLLAELHRLVGCEPLVHIVQQFDFLAKLLAANFEQLQRATEIVSRFEEWLVMQRLNRRVSASSRPVARHARNADLYPNIAE